MNDAPAASPVKVLDGPAGATRELGVVAVVVIVVIVVVVLVAADGLEWRGVLRPRARPTDRRADVVAPS